MTASLTNTTVGNSLARPIPERSRPLHHDPPGSLPAHVPDRTTFLPGPPPEP